MNEAIPPAAAEPARCGNCGAELLGPHCHRCGQPVKGLVRHFSSILGDFLDSVFELDNRLWRTLAPLLLRPGYLSREYFTGRRVRYVSPVRLFVFMSVLAFFAAQFAFDIDSGGTDAGRARTDPSAPKIRFGGREDWDPESNPVRVEWLSEGGNAWLNRQVARAAGNIERVQADPNLLKDAVLGALPSTLFVLLPLFALLLKLAYAFRRRLYMEHLIVALHSHAFLCAALLLAMGLDALAGRWSPFGTMEKVLFAWMPVYLLLTQKRVYGQGWPLTLLKFAFVGTVYLSLLTIGVVFTILGSLVWL